MPVWAQQPQRFSMRYGARHPWLAPWPRAGLYLVWRALIAGFRPVLFLTLLLAAAGLALRAAHDLPRQAAPAPSLSAEIDQALHQAAPYDRDRHTYWVDQLDSALQAPRRTMPDLPRARSVAESYVALRGRDALALEHLAQGRRISHVEAELRALPAWLRERRLDQAIEARLSEGYAQGLEPNSLVFAPALMRLRLQRADRLFGPALADAEAWFVDPGGRALALDALPGLSPRSTRLYGDVRGLVVRGCAVLSHLNRPAGQCRVGFLPKPQSDPILAGLALAAAGADPQRRAGARLIKAAWAAGRLDAALAETLALGPDPVLGQEAMLASATPLLTQAGEAWTQPARFNAAAMRAAQESARSAGIDGRARDRVFNAFTALRREVGALAALRLADTVTSPEDAEALARLAAASDGRLLALHSLSRPQLLALIEPVGGRASPTMDIRDWPVRAQRFAGLALACIVLAVLLLAASLYGGLTREWRARPGGLERLDALMSRLILGRNI